MVSQNVMNHRVVIIITTTPAAYCHSHHHRASGALVDILAQMAITVFPSIRPESSKNLPQAARILKELTM